MKIPLLRLFRRNPKPVGHVLFLSFAQMLRSYSIWFDPFYKDKYHILRRGLFYLRQDMESVMDPFKTVPEFVEPLHKELSENHLLAMSMESFEELYLTLNDHLHVADREGRVLWRAGEQNSFAELSKFLEGFGYPPMPEEMLRGAYLRLAVKNWAEEQKLALTVFAG